MNNAPRLGWMVLSTRFFAAFALTALLAAGCSDGGGGSGGSTSTGGTGGTTDGTGGTTGGTGGTGGTTGGTGGTLPSCDSLQPAAYQVRTVLHENQKPWTNPDPADPPKVTVSGTVDATGMGSLTLDCGSLAGKVGALLSIVDANGTSWTACYTGPDATMPLALGDVVDITLETAWYGFGNPSFSLTVRKQGALMVFALDDESNDLTPPPEISIASGEKVCDGGDASYCAMDGYVAVVTVGGEQSELTAGSSSMVGDYDVHLGTWGVARDMLVCDGPLSAHYLFAVRPLVP